MRRGMSFTQAKPGAEFESLVKVAHAERGAKGLSRLRQFLAMPFCPLGRGHCLCEIEGGLKSRDGKQALLGI